MVMTISSKGHARQQAILNAARRALLSEGYAHLSIREVAKRIGISIGNLQYYYQTKDDLVAAIIQQETTNSIGLLDDLAWAPDQLETSVREAVSRVIKYLAGPSGRLYFVLGTLALTEAKFQALHRRVYDHALSVAANLLALLAPDRSTHKHERLASVSIALIDGAALRLQGMEAGEQSAELASLIGDLTHSIVTLIQAE